MYYEFLLIDWDGCVIDSLNLWRTEIKKHLLSLGVQASDRDVVSKAMGIRHAANNFGLDVSYEDFWAPIRELVEAKIAEVKLLPEVEETLNILHSEGVHMGVVTSSAGRVFEISFNKRALSKLFKASVTASDVNNLKPDAEPALLLMKRLNANPSKTLMVGDSPHDIGAGKNAGIDTCLFYPRENQAFYNHEELVASGATYFIESFSDLLGIIRNQPNTV